jgi:hypothetical protein
MTLFSNVSEDRESAEGDAAATLDAVVGSDARAVPPPAQPDAAMQTDDTIQTDDTSKTARQHRGSHERFVRAEHPTVISDPPRAARIRRSGWDSRLR